MDVLEDDQVIQAVLSRSDFVGGIDNEALDFSQLEHFINDDTDDNHTYFGDTLSNNESVSPTRHLPSVVVSVEGTTTASSTGTTSPHPNQLVAKPSATSAVANFSQQNTATVVVDGTVYSHPSHNLPESPPDSGSEPPYSPQAHSPHQKVTPSAGLQDLLLQSPVSVPGHQASLGNTIYGKPPHTIHIQGSDTVLVQHPAVLTPLLTHQQQTTAANNTLALAAAHAGLPTSNISEEHQTNGITAIYTSLNNGAKKRKLSEDNVRVKQETELCNDDELSYQEGPGEGSMYLDSSSFQCIRFQPFQQTAWHTLCDQNLKELPIPHYRVDADKGFNFSNADDAFVCQKKNHFQITCHTQLQGDAQFVKTQDGLRKIGSFHLHFYGVKVESPTQTIKVEQSQSDRSKKAFHPVLVDLHGEQLTKVTVGRLHFSETTSNNMRKKGKPNPDQRYFYLVVGLHAHCNDSNHYPIISHASERIIVRASNPGQFESDVELCWQRGSTPDSIYHAGKVGVNTDRPDEALVVHGNLKVTGHIVHPSDARAKRDIQECDSKEQLRNLQQLRVVKYKYDPAFSQHCGLDTESDTGIIAQELQNVLPEAVMPAGDIILPNGTKIDNFLVVNKERILMESVGAVKELCKVTDNLENRIDELERINRRLVKLKRFDSIKSINSTLSSMTKSSVSKKSGKSKCSEKNVMCYNQIIQVTIIVLVLIMAFCLLSMTTLYFLELQKRNHFDRPVGYPSFKTSDERNLGGSRFHSTTTSLFLDTVDTRLNQTDVTTFGKNWFAPPDRIVHDNKGLYGPDTTGLDHIPSSLGRSTTCSIPADFSHKCQITCCEQDNIRSSNNYHYTSDQYHIGRPEMTPATNAIEEARENLGHRRQSLVKQPDTWIKSHHKLSSVSRAKRDAEEWLENSYPNSESLAEPVQYDVAVTVTGSNFTCTLGAEFCDRGEIDYSICTNLSPYNYSYVIPISRYLSDSFIVVRFIFSNAWPTQLVMPCPGIVRPVKCLCDHYSLSLGAEQSHLGSEGQFTVNIVQSQSLALRYRVPLMETSDLCSLSEDNLGVTFLEYNIFLFRDCED
ncbi:myelin regulatory factor isoform X2 [Lycorma delicatula]|uniref:myelin regulatory factor isoform X2 n=1 Tax=Lycorma delicatula TaxID=130591 RepID=UPI003F51A1EF